MSQVLYGERSWNPPAQTVELTEERLRRGGRTTPLDELHLGATAEAYRRGYWREAAARSARSTGWPRAPGSSR
ncbi:hypothetical protein [[Kitasatospora] papulosa]|uniref:hypothetical protein n=1 Tax=[Kitasatospora] papulosa TaxID=1464011 RepID=UPI00367857E0